MNRFLALSMIALLTSATATADEQPFSAEDYEYFELQIRPLLSEHCYSCHSTNADVLHAGLQLDTADGVSRGGESGPLLTPGKPENSLLIEVLCQGGDIEMPPDGRLPDSDIKVLTEWVRRGAPFPVSHSQPRASDAEIDLDEGRKFWSFQPLSPRELPDVTDSHWPSQRIDRFVLAGMERAGLKASPPADRATLARRLFFAVMGLPPTPEDVDSFVNDDSPEAYEQLVDRLLASPQYGEKWARLWLDAARYTDQTASWLDQPGEPWLYRDWVVNAFNDGMPYDEFIHRQLATDLMPETGPEDLAALGFVSLSPRYWKELKLPCEIIKVIIADEWEERVDAVSRTFLGLTVACARCHDHKFDPITSEDYYALAGVFASCRHAGRPLIPDDRYQPVQNAKGRVQKLEAEMARLKKQRPLPREQLADLKASVAQIVADTPLYDTPLASALAEESLYVVRAGATPQDGTKLEYRPGPRDLPLFVRGNPNRPADIVPRRFLSVLSTRPKPFQNGSGRLELAHAITTDAAALTARVIVNRIWLAHFGRGLVSTPSNFGQQGDRPTHPELLDDLAARFVISGWSIKDLHREILLSATWQQSSLGSDESIAVDPDNRWLSRANRRRLDFECWRDAMLHVTGSLELRVGGPSMDVDDPNNPRRTLYATVHRRDMSTTLQIHDFPDPTQHSPQRSLTTTSLQGLYALNGPLLARQSEVLVERLHHEAPARDEQRIRRAYQLLFQRIPTEREQQLGLEFLGDGDDEEGVRLALWRQYAHILLASNEFLFLD